MRARCINTIEKWEDELGSVGDGGGLCGKKIEDGLMQTGSVKIGMVNES